jgi:hypothetical protein
MRKRSGRLGQIPVPGGDLQSARPKFYRGPSARSGFIISVHRDLCRDPAELVSDVPAP